MYRYVLFDADKTLLDFDKAQLVCIEKVLSRYGYEFSVDKYREYERINHELWYQFERGEIGQDIVQSKRFKDFFDVLGINVDGERVNDMYQRELCKQSWLIPYAEEICRKLFPHSILSIVTNGVGHTQAMRIDHSEIRKYISHVVISEQVGYAKPDRKFFEEAFKIIGCNERENILIVGDSITSDIQGGINAGIDTCWYNPCKLKDKEGIKANYLITDLRELEKIVLS